MVIENWLPQVFLWSLHVPICAISMYMYMYTQTPAQTRSESMWCRFSFCSWRGLSGLDFPSVFLTWDVLPAFCFLAVLCDLWTLCLRWYSSLLRCPAPHPHPLLGLVLLVTTQKYSFVCLFCFYLSELFPTTKPNRMKHQFLILSCILSLSVLDLSLRMFVTCSLGFLTVLPAPPACVPFQHTLEALQCLQKGGRELLPLELRF